jgi:soluble lytic murein transglycosylase-like protein
MPSANYWRVMMREQQTGKHKTFVWIAAGVLALSLATDVLAQNHTTTRRRVRSQSRFSPELAGQITRIAREEGLDPMLTLEIMRVESGFNRLARSPKGAMGLMQMIPATALRFGVTNPYDPSQAIRGGCRYLKFLSERYGGRLELAVAAYNAGEGAVDRYGGRIPPYQETREYVAAVMSGYKRAKQIEEAVLKRRGGTDLRAHYVSSKGSYQHSKQILLTTAQVRIRLENFGRIPKLGRISDTEVQR